MSFKILKFFTSAAPKVFSRAFNITIYHLYGIGLNARMAWLQFFRETVARQGKMGNLRKFGLESD
jgi:hypothetical protein